jgi:hypothetical protein
MEFKTNKNWKFSVTKASNHWDSDEKTITFESLEDLMKFIKEVGPIVVNPNQSIIIYDDYLE